MVARRIAVALSFVLALSSAALAGDGWTHYANPALAVSIDLPGSPEVEVEPGKDGELTWTTTTVFASPRDDAFFGLMVTDYSVDISSVAADALTGAIEGQRSEFKGQVISRTDITVEGSPGVDVFMRNDDNGYQLHSRMVIRGARLYQILALGKAKLPAETDRFFASFKMSAP